MSVRIVNKKAFDESYAIGMPNPSMWRKLAKADRAILESAADLWLGIPMGTISIMLLSGLSIDLFSAGQEIIGGLVAAASLLLAVIGVLIWLANFSGLYSFFWRIFFVNTRRKKTLQSLCDEPFLAGTEDSSRPLVDYKISQKIHDIGEEQKKVEFSAQSFFQDPKQGWTEISIPLSKKATSASKVVINLGDKQWRDQVVAAKLIFQQSVEEDCLHYANSIKAKDKGSHVLPQTSKEIENQEILDLLERV